jgi:hypothetical protein
MRHARQGWSLASSQSTQYLFPIARTLRFYTFCVGPVSRHHKQNQSVRFSHSLMCVPNHHESTCYGMMITPPLRISNHIELNLTQDSAIVMITVNSAMTTPATFFVPPEKVTCFRVFRLHEELGGETSCQRENLKLNGKVQGQAPGWHRHHELLPTFDSPGLVSVDR